jgi:hypothetical protein
MMLLSGRLLLISWVGRSFGANLVLGGGPPDPPAGDGTSSPAPPVVMGRKLEGAILVGFGPSHPA